MTATPQFATSPSLLLPRSMESTRETTLLACTFSTKNHNTTLPFGRLGGSSAAANLKAAYRWKCLSLREWGSGGDVFNIGRVAHLLFPGKPALTVRSHFIAAGASFLLGSSPIESILTTGGWPGKGFLILIGIHGCTIFL